MTEFKDLDHLAEHYAGIPIPGPIALVIIVSSKQTGFVYQLLFQPRYDELTKFVNANQLIVQYLQQGKDEYVTIKGEELRELDKNEVYAKNLFAMIHATKEIDSLVDSLLVPIRNSFEQTASRQVGSLPPARLVKYPLSDTYRLDLRLVIHALEHATANDSCMAGLQRIMTHHLPERSEPSAFLSMREAFDVKTKEENLSQIGDGPSGENPRSSRILVTNRMSAKEAIGLMIDGANKLITS